jgi:predicted MFS family arabinose efflux permease
LDARKSALFILASINFTHIMDAMIMMPLGDLFMQLFLITPGEFSMLVSSYAVGAFISSLLGSFYLDLYDRKKALLFIYSGFKIGTILCAVSGTYVLLLSVRFITGLFGGMIGALVLSVVSDLYPFEKRGNAIGYLMAAFSAAAALGVPTGLFLADQFSWRAPFLFIGGAGFLITILITLKFPSLKAHLSEIDPNRSIKSIFLDIFTDRNQTNALLLGIILVFGHFVIIPFIAPYMTRNVGFTQGQITYIYLIGGILTVFSSPLIGKMTDRIGALKSFRILMVISFVPVILITNLPLVAVPVALVVTSFFFVFGSGRMIPPQTLITAAVGPKNRGSFMSVKSALQQLGIALAAAISGFIVTFDESEQLANYEWVGVLSIVVSLCAMMLAGKLIVAKGN